MAAINAAYQVALNFNGCRATGEQQLIEMAAPYEFPMRFFVECLKQGFYLHKSILVGNQPEFIGMTTKHILDELAEFRNLIHRAETLPIDQQSHHGIFLCNMTTPFRFATCFYPLDPARH